MIRNTYLLFISIMFWLSSYIIICFFTRWIITMINMHTKPIARLDKQRAIYPIFNFMHRLLYIVFFQLAFPYCYDIPPHIKKFLLVIIISFYIAFNFVSPKFYICFRICYVIMSVPKTAVNKDAYTIFSQYNIWRSW